MTSSGEGPTGGAAGLTVHVRGAELLVGVRVMPSAARTEFRGLYGDRLKVAVNAPPEAGKANARLLQALADWLGLRSDLIVVRAGHASRDKVVAFSGIREDELREKLSRLLQATETTG